MLEALMMCLNTCQTAVQALTYAFIILGLLGLASVTAVRLFLI